MPRCIDADLFEAKLNELLEETREIGRKSRTEKDARRASDTGAGIVCSLYVLRDMPTVFIEAEPVNGWISIKDRLPEPKTWVMVYIEYPSPVLELERGIQKTNSIKKIFYDGKSFYCDYGNITHWMPLPEPPKGE